MRIDPATVLAAAQDPTQRRADTPMPAREQAAAADTAFTADRPVDMDTATANLVLERLRQAADKARSSHRDILAAELRRTLDTVQALQLAGPPLEMARTAARYAKDIADLSWHLGIAATAPGGNGAADMAVTAATAEDAVQGKTLKGLLRGALGQIRGLQQAVNAAERRGQALADPAGAELPHLALVVRQHAARAAKALDHVGIRLPDRDIVL